MLPDKEKILNKACSVLGDYEPMLNSHAYKAMDEYAKDMAIEFAKWMDGDGWQLLGKDKWCAFSRPEYSSEELYNLYINSQK